MTHSQALQCIRIGHHEEEMDIKGDYTNFWKTDIWNDGWMKPSAHKIPTVIAGR